MPNHFHYYLRVRYGECDAQKVVFNARYAEYIDLATTEFLRALGYGEQLFSGELDFQLVKQTIEWKAPARFDQVLEDFCLCQEPRQHFIHAGRRIPHCRPRAPDRDGGNSLCAGEAAHVH